MIKYLHESDDQRHTCNHADYKGDAKPSHDIGISVVESNFNVWVTKIAPNPHSTRSRAQRKV